MKKYLKLIIGVLIVIAVIVVGYLLWRHLNLTEVLFGPQEEAPTTALPEKLNALTDIPIFDYWVNKKTGVVYYLAEAGQVVKIQNNTQEIVNSQTLNRLNSVASSYDGSYAAVKFNYPAFPTFSIFNTTTNNWQPLPPKTIVVAWSPNSQEILYLDDKMLQISNLATQKNREVLKMTQKELDLKWISDSNVLISENPSIEFPSTIWILNLKNKTLLPLIEKESGLTTQWSNDGEIGIKLHNQNRTPITSLIDKDGTTLAALTFITLPSKCLIENDKAYCAVPKNIREGIVLPDDYYKKAVYFDDNLYLIDLSAGSSKVLLENSDTLIDAEHLELHNNALLFKNRLDGKLYSLEIQ